MARTLDIETLVEDAFIAQLPDFVDSGVTVRGGDDIRDKTLTPMVTVKAHTVDEIDGTWNIYCATSLLVDIVVTTSKRIDEDGRSSNEIRGHVRNLVNQDNIQSLLNAEEGLFVYNNGVIPQSSTTVEDDRLWYRTVTVLVMATTIDAT